MRVILTQIFWSGLTMTLTRHKTKRKTTMESKQKLVRAYVKLPRSVTRIWRGDERTEYRKKTKSNTAWCLRKLNEWPKERNAMSSSLCINERYQFVNLDLLETDEEELCYWFSKFIVEVRQKRIQECHTTMPVLCEIKLEFILFYFVIVAKGG